MTPTPTASSVVLTATTTTPIATPTAPIRTTTRCVSTTTATTCDATNTDGAAPSSATARTTTCNGLADFPGEEDDVDGDGVLCRCADCDDSDAE